MRCGSGAGRKIFTGKNSAERGAEKTLSNCPHDLRFMFMGCGSFTRRLAVADDIAIF
jgi:hypothetical protein